MSRSLIATARPHNCIRNADLNSQCVALSVGHCGIGIEAQTVLVAKLFGN